MTFAMPSNVVGGFPLYQPACQRLKYVPSKFSASPGVASTRFVSPALGLVTSRSLSLQSPRNTTPAPSTSASRENLRVIVSGLLKSAREGNGEATQCWEAECIDGVDKGRAGDTARVARALAGLGIISAVVRERVEVSADEPDGPVATYPRDLA